MSGGGFTFLNARHAAGSDVGFWLIAAKPEFRTLLGGKSRA
jgi:hypothetical protein